MKSLSIVFAALSLAFVGCGDPGTSKNEPVVINNSTNGQTTVVTFNNTTAANSGTTTTPPNNSTSTSCGDGTLDPDEACDDSNRADKDGCSAVCEIETVVLRNLEAVLQRGDSVNCAEFYCEASYKVTLTLQNFTDMQVDRVTNMRLTLNGLEMSTGGVTCTDDVWLIFPDSRSEIIDILVNYDSPQYEMRAPCSGSDAYAYVGAETVPFPAAGQVTFEITGLLDDGSVWTTEGTTDLKDLR